MKQEQTQTPVTQSAPSAPRRNGKSVVTYIMILFIAAFLLMALSFLMHQRSNSQALGELETSVNATIEEMQETQLRIVALEKELTETKAALEIAEADSAEAAAQLEKMDRALSAQRALYAIGQLYYAGDYEGCAALIAEAEEQGLDDALPSSHLTTSEGVTTAPFVRFQQFKYAVTLKLAEQEAPAE